MIVTVIVKLLPDDFAGGDGATASGDDQVAAISSDATMRPRPWRRAIAPGTHPQGSIWPWEYGCYFALTGVSVGDTGVRTDGKPDGIEWI